MSVYKIRLKKGDQVVVLAGKEKGRTGKITATHPTLNKVTVEGINVVKKAIKPDRTHPRGGIIEITKPIWVSKIAILEPTSKKPTRIGYKIGTDGKKIRVFKKNGKVIQPSKLPKDKK